MDVTLLGQVVISKAGRDAGRKFIIVDDIDVMYVLIADGDLRKVEKPKKKKLKHIELTGVVASEIRDKLLNNQKATNAEIRKAIAATDS